MVSELLPGLRSVVGLLRNGRSIRHQSIRVVPEKAAQVRVMLEANGHYRDLEAAHVPASLRPLMIGICLPECGAPPSDARLWIEDRTDGRRLGWIDLTLERGAGLEDRTFAMYRAGRLQVLYPWRRSCS